MQVGKKQDPESERGDQLPGTSASDDYRYLGIEIGYMLETNLGTGNYRFVFSPTSEDFKNPSGTDSERRLMVSLSFDQQFGKNWGAFLRANLQSEEAVVDYNYNLAGGLDVRGGAWGRARDNVGLGIAHFHGGNQDIEGSGVAEGYYRWVLDDHAAVTANIQTMRDDKTKGKDPGGFIFGVRADFAL